MIWLVRVALRRPYTFIVLALAIIIIGALAVLRTPTDIFPAIRVPVIGVAWSYNGLSPDEMAGHVITPYERVVMTTVDGIQHIESQSLPGIGIVKIYFHHGVDIRTALAQVTSISQTILKQMPPGVTPPLIVDYDASTVPVLQVATSSKSLGEQKILDLTQNFMRPVLATIPGIAIPYPYGGKVRQIQVDLDPKAMQARGLSASQVAAAIARQYQILPTGSVRIGGSQYTVRLNDETRTVAALNDLPIKVVDGATIYLHDVGYVRNGSPPQKNVVHVDGRRSVLTPILKTGGGSTLAVVRGVERDLPRLRAMMPRGFRIRLLDDQSLFVKGAIAGVVREGLIAAALTSLMIFLFLGDPRSTLIIATSIPLACLAAVAALSAAGQTLNIMTIGGLALAVGILVDDGTVTIENINWHLEHGKDVKTAILDGAAQIVTPAFVSLLCICVVFVPMFELPGVAGYLFAPMAEAVVFAMVASFLLSRTLVPTLAMYLLKPHRHRPGHDYHLAAASRNPLMRLQRAFEPRFERIRAGYRALMSATLSRRRPVLLGAALAVLASFALAPFLGEDFFPTVDSGAMELHVSPPAGTRIEDAAAEFGRIENEIRRVVRPGDLASVIDNIGLPVSPLNMIYNNSGTTGYEDGDIYVNLKSGHRPTADYMGILRRKLPRMFPGTTFAFLPADIVSQILNFGAPAPLDVQVIGNDVHADHAYAIRLLRRMRAIPGIADARIEQSGDSPQLDVDVDRSRIAQFGLTEQDVTDSLATALAGTSQTAPAFWLDRRTGISYAIVAQTPQWQVDSLSDLENLPIAGASSGGNAEVLGGLASIRPARSDAVVSHYDVRPVIDIFASTQGRDLGGVASRVRALLRQTAQAVPRGSRVVLRGQVRTMSTAYRDLFVGLFGAVVMIYLLIVMNFQSWVDPLIIVSALPAGLAGIVWMLYATHTPLSVPALTGTIMCMGVATANSILVVSFARERLAAGSGAVEAALEAGSARFRPVVMTALAMIFGMLPMALGFGEGGAQNAPLGRAVIGGLLFATCATLLVVPAVFSILHGHRGHAGAGAASVAPSDTGSPHA